MNGIGLRVCACVSLTICFAITLWLSVAPAFAFGTVRELGQNSEHERITRHALSCRHRTGPNCFEPATLVQLAGEKDNFGAIGAPDRGHLIPEGKAHCDGADYFDVPGYPQTRRQAQAKLERCRNFMLANLAAVIRDAGGLLDRNGRLRKSQLGMPCLFVGEIRGRAKCNVIQDMGLLMHTAQDFYSHSNWVDVSDPDRPISADNPPGLGHREPAPWISLRYSYPFPDGLVTGCSVTKHCTYGPHDDLHRITHTVLNKDNGQIDPEIGVGTTPRGRIADNFARAVTAAIADTADKWALIQEKLIKKYGEEDGALMACAISHDEPMRDCR
jgi:hypothetical protein